MENPDKAFFICLKSNKNICKTLYAHSAKKACKLFAKHIDHTEGSIEVLCQPALELKPSIFLIDVKTSFNITEVIEQ